MTSARPPRSYRTARERVALRRAATGRPRNRLRRRGNGCSSIVIGLAAILLLGAVALVAFSGFASGVLGGIEDEDPRRAAAGALVATPETDGEKFLPRTPLEPFNMLLLGVDTRSEQDEGARSDTLIVVHVHPDEKWASMLSIPRDSMVQIPYIGQNKINVAYPSGYMLAEELYGAGTSPAAGGAALAAEAVENLLAIPIDYTAQVDFRGFERMIDIMGGLMIDVPRPILDPEYPTENYGFERIYIPAGLQVFDGETALRYARSRHGNTDFDRSCRQQRVLRAILRQVRERDLLDQMSQIPDMVDNVEQSVSTTLPISDPGVIYTLADVARSLSSERILQLSINPDNVQVISEQGSNIYWNQPDIDALVDRMLAGPLTEEAATETVRIQVLNGAGVRGLATSVTRNLGTQGFAMVEPGDAPRRYEVSTIIDYTGQPETRQQLADLLAIDAAYVQAQPAADAPPAPFNTDVVLILGADYQQEWAQLNESTPVPTPAPALDAPAPAVPDLPPSCSPDF